jgi:cytidine deaminase
VSSIRISPDLQAKLIAAAIDVRSRAYAPYSLFQVGAALLCGDGSIVTGCNVENASLGLTLCAERVAVSKAVADGKKQFVGMAIAASPLATPCGSCRQFMAEFEPRLEIIAVDAQTGEAKTWRLDDLLPERFTWDKK